MMRPRLTVLGEEASPASATLAAQGFGGANQLGGRHRRCLVRYGRLMRRFGDLRRERKKVVNKFLAICVHSQPRSSSHGRLAWRGKSSSFRGLAADRMSR